MSETFKNMVDDVIHISENVYRKFSEQSSNRFRYKYFPYFKLVRMCGSYKYHFFSCKTRLPIKIFIVLTLELTVILAFIFVATFIELSKIK